MKTTFHFHLDVRGVLKTWDDARLHGLLRHPDGRKMTAAEVKEVLLDELVKGHVVLPLSHPPCDGFDFGGKGCPGHPDVSTGE